MKKKDSLEAIEVLQNQLNDLKADLNKKPETFEDKALHLLEKIEEKLEEINNKQPVPIVYPFVNLTGYWYNVPYLHWHPYFGICYACNPNVLYTITSGATTPCDMTTYTIQYDATIPYTNTNAIGIGAACSSYNYNLTN
jgi:hypothetical protein